ncbi:LysR family transcriptional regulator [Amorphus orientalis]|uniref:LysR family transcriptional regulator n=1 Tax=Amorphus orientalis TaxID=649198 RepID=UPI0027D790BC|nr:LysR family transcriptional regulator [Amorphus orientalis]
MVNSVNLRQLRAFVMVADKGSFVKAAAALNLSQPALSQCIRQLEDHIGSPLFNRTTRSVYITPLGLSFIPHARDILRQFDNLMANVQDTVQRRQGNVTVACLPSVASRLMPRVLAVNEKQFPNIHVTIRDSNMKGVAAMILSGDADFGIGSAVVAHSDLDACAFAKDMMCVVVPVTSPLARKRAIRWADLDGQPFVAMSHETGIRDLVDETVEKLGISLKIVSEISNLATLSGMIEEGIGISAAPDLALPRENQSLIRRRPLSNPTIRRPISLFWKKGQGLSPAASAILASLHRCIVDGEMEAHFPNVEWDHKALEKTRLF